MLKSAVIFLNGQIKTEKACSFFGAKPEVVETLAKRSKREYPGIYLCGYENGYVKDKDAVLERIAEKRAGYFTDCTGSPNAGTPDPQAYGVF